MLDAAASVDRVSMAMAWRLVESQVREQRAGARSSRFGMSCDTGEV